MYPGINGVKQFTADIGIDEVGLYLSTTDIGIDEAAIYCWYWAIPDVFRTPPPPPLWKTYNSSWNWDVCRIPAVIFSKDSGWRVWKTLLKLTKKQEWDCERPWCAYGRHSHFLIFRLENSQKCSNSGRIFTYDHHLD